MLEEPGDFTGGQNAAVAVLSKGQLTMNQSNITTNSAGAVGMIVSGEGTQLEANESSAYTSGVSSPAFIVREGGFGLLAVVEIDVPKRLLAHGGDEGKDDGIHYQT